MSQLPVVDISPIASSGGAINAGTECDEVATALAAACREIGFVIVRGHGIPAATIKRLRKAVIELFALPLAQKRALSVRPDNYRGYIPLGFFTPNAGGVAPDRYEGYKLHWDVDRSDPVCARCSLYGPNRWPPQLPSVRAAVAAYWTHCDRVSRVLMRALAQAAGIDPETLLRTFTQPLTNMTLLHYPPGAADCDETGIHPHKDTDALTLLAPDPVGGLQVRPPGQARWICADAPDDALIVNIGDILEVWSGGYYVSTPHRVLTQSAGDRYSFPYFAVPRFDVRVKPLRPAQPGFVQREIPVGEVSRDIWQSNWPDAAPIGKAYNPATP